MALKSMQKLLLLTPNPHAPGIKQYKHEAKMLRMHDKSCNMVKGASRCHPPRTSRFKNEDRVQTLALEDERAE